MILSLVGDVKQMEHDTIIFCDGGTMRIRKNRISPDNLQEFYPITYSKYKKNGALRVEITNFQRQYL